MKKIIFFIPAVIFCLSLFAQVPSKLAHVDSQQLLDNMPSRKKSMDEINNLSTRADEELKQMDTNIQKEYNAYMARQSSQSQQMNQYDEGRLQKMQTDMQSREQEIQQILKTKSEELNDKILSTVKKAVTLVANRKGLDYVIDLSSALFAKGPDITQEVLAELLRLDAAK